MANSLEVAQVYTKFTTKGLKETNNSVDSLKGKLSSLTKIAAGLVSTMALKNVATSFIKAAKEAEDYRTSIRAVSKSVKEADATFARVKNWAEVNPVDTAEAIGAFVRLKTAAVANAEESLEAIGNLSTVMHRDMRDVANAVVTTETESLRALGIMVDKSGDKAIVESNGVRVAVEKDLNSIRRAIIEVMGKAYAGAIEENKNTWTGALKTMGGLWQKFKTDVMGEGKASGAFGSLKNILVYINNEWEAFTKSESYKELVSNIQGALVKGIEMAASGVRTLGRLFTFAKNNADGLKTVVVAIAAYRLTLGLGSLINNILLATTHLKEMVALAKAAGILSLGSHGGLIAGGVAAVTAGAYYLNAKKKSKEAGEAIKSLYETLGDSPDKQKIQSTLDGVNARIKELTDNRKISLTTKLSDLNATDKEIRLLKTQREELEKLNSVFKNVVEEKSTGNPETKGKGGVVGEKVSDLNKLTEAVKETAKETVDASEELLKRLQEQKTAAAEAQAAVMAAFRDERSMMSWLNSEGLMSDSDYLSYLKERFADLKSEMGGLADNVMNWTEPMRSLFSDIQGMAASQASEAMASLNRQYDYGRISAAQYATGLEDIRRKFEEYPAVVKMAEEKLKLFHDEITRLPTIQSQVAQATSDMDMAFATLPSRIGDAFGAAIRGSESLSDSMKNLLKDVSAVVAKAFVMNALFGGSFNGGKLNFGRGLLGGIGKLFGFHTGGIVGKNGAVRSAASLIPSFHTGGIPGLKGDEVLAKLQTGEAVFSRKDVRNLGRMGDALKGDNTGKGDTYMTVNVQAVDAMSFASMLEGGKETITSIVVRNIMRNGDVRTAIKGAY